MDFFTSLNNDESYYCFNYPQLNEEMSSNDGTHSNLIQEINHISGNEALIFSNLISHENNDYYHNPNNHNSIFEEAYNNVFVNPIIEEDDEQSNGITDSNINGFNSQALNNNNSFLNKKRNRTKIFGLIRVKKQNQENKNDTDINKGNNAIKLGRKKKAEANTGNHKKISEDNIAIKIKGYFFQYIRDITKKNSIYDQIDFKKLSYTFISDLNKKKNEVMFQMTIKDILSSQPISTKNKRSNRFENRNIINKIYDEGKEINVIKILDLTFKELFIIFREKLINVQGQKDSDEIERISNKIEGLDLLDNNNEYKDAFYFIEELKQKKDDHMTKEEYNKYIKNVENICVNYEQWFNKKTARISKKSK